MNNAVRNKELMFYQSGEMTCEPRHSYGPAVRDHYLIHFICGGKGFYEINNKKYKLKKGQAFLIYPDAITYYEADEKDPWEYMWIGFNGDMVGAYLEQAYLNEEHLIFDFNLEPVKEILSRMNKLTGVGDHKAFMRLGLLYQLIGELAGHQRQSIDVTMSQQGYVREAINYIRMNYSRSITVLEIANHLNINRSYFYSLFKSELEQSPKEYLTHYRMTKASELMETQDLTVSQIARSVGYDDPLLFSKTFKKEYGVSPKYYRAEMK